MKDIAVARYEAFGTAGNAAKIVPLGLEKITDQYGSGRLNHGL
jgi:fructose-bisphosphate aldolase class II